MQLLLDQGEGGQVGGENVPSSYIIMSRLTGTPREVALVIQLISVAAGMLLLPIT